VTVTVTIKGLDKFKVKYSPKLIIEWKGSDTDLKDIGNYEIIIELKDSTETAEIKISLGIVAPGAKT